MACKLPSAIVTMASRPPNVDAQIGRPVYAWDFITQPSSEWRAQCTPVFAEAAQTASAESVSTNVEPDGQSEAVTILAVLTS